MTAHAPPGLSIDVRGGHRLAEPSVSSIADTLPIQLASHPRTPFAFSRQVLEPPRPAESDSGHQAQPNQR